MPGILARLILLILVAMINLIPLTDNYTLYQVNDYQEIPAAIFKSEFYSITRTKEEISILTNCDICFDNIKSEKEWRGFMVAGILEFSMVGIINEITKPLRENEVSVFVISTFNTDYIFVKKESFQKAYEIFKMTDGFNIQNI